MRQEIEVGRLETGERQKTRGLRQEIKIQETLERRQETVGFRYNFLDHRRLSESQNKLPSNFEACGRCKLKLILKRPDGVGLR